MGVERGNVAGAVVLRHGHQWDTERLQEAHPISRILKPQRSRTAEWRLFEHGRIRCFEILAEGLQPMTKPHDNVGED